MKPEDHSSKLSVMLVDDERLARVHLRRLLEQSGAASVIAEAGDLETARTLLETRRPQLLFLDVRLSPGSGFDLLPDVPPATATVFLTAHAEFAVRAFEVNALDYLLKPTSGDRVAAVLEKARVTMGHSRDRQVVYVGNKSDWKCVPIQQIGAIAAEGVYSRVVTRAGQSHLMHRGLNHWEKLLGESGFVRIDRSILVNSTALQSFRSRSRDHSLLGIDGLTQPVALGRAGTYRARQLWESFGNEEKEADS
jgi:two-component system, LytTR family, response regulator